MHWFDRLSRGVAERPGIPDLVSTRRGLLKGAAMATAAATVAPALARAAPRPLGRGSAGPACEECIRQALEQNQAKVNACSGPDARARPGAGGKKGAKKYPIPAQAARRAACRARARKSLGGALQGCAATACESNGVEKEQPPELGTHATCPEGTSACTKNMCCSAGDACCLCPSGPEGYICCAGVIGCTCCG